MAKPSVYVDTNILSALHYRGANEFALRRQRITRDWWDNERQSFEVYASRAVEGELAAGVYPGKDRALAEVRRLPYFPQV